MRYRKELKRQILQSLAESGRIRAVAKRYGVRTTTIRRWAIEARMQIARGGQRLKDPRDP